MSTSDNLTASVFAQRQTYAQAARLAHHLPAAAAASWQAYCKQSGKTPEQGV